MSPKVKYEDISKWEKCSDHKLIGIKMKVVRADKARTFLYLPNRKVAKELTEKLVEKFIVKGKSDFTLETFLKEYK